MTNLAGSQLEYPLKADAQFFFMHIPKTAGTTLIQVLEQQFDEKEIARWLYPFQFLDTPPGYFNQHRYFHGHVEYSVMRGFLPQPPVTMTMLREPVKRYLSHFNNHKRVSPFQTPDISFDVFTRLQQTSLADFVQNPPEILIPFAHYLQNLQATMLAFEFQRELVEPRVALGNLIEMRYMLPRPTVVEAQERLDQLAFVGLSERFQESLFLLAYTFGWFPVVEFETLNVTPKRLSQAELPTELVGEIQTLNEVDQVVYDYGKQLFEKRYEQMCQELLERYGRRGHSQLKLPLPKDVMVELLDTHYRQRFVERNTAVPALKFEFDRKISGRNWQVLEQDLVHGAFRWSGPGRSSTLDLPLAANADVWLRFSVAMTITEEVLASLVVKVNDEQVEVGRRRLENGATICEGYVPQAVLARHPDCVRVSFEIAQTVMPIEVIPGSEDDRLLGIALNWLEVEPALPLLEECNRLKTLLGENEEALSRFKRPLAVPLPRLNEIKPGSNDVLGVTRECSPSAIGKELTGPLEFPEPQHPQVTIVMVTYGCRDIVAEALALLKAHTEPHYELIIVDSASPDDTGDWIESNVRGARLNRSEANIGYGAGSNIGAKQARAPLLLFMNPDVLVLPNWLPPLINAMKLPRVGAAGPQLRYPNGVLQAAGSLVFRTGTTARYGDGDPNADALAYRYPRVADYLSGACLLVKRELFYRVGGFDPVFGQGYYEDVDLCFKLASLDYLVRYVPPSVVRHIRDASGGSRTLASTVQRNQHLFEQRWREVLRTRPTPQFPTNPSVILHARDIRAPLRILLLGSAISRASELLQHDCRLAITAAGCKAADLAEHLEVVESCADWSEWFHTRRLHYDLVAGHDVRFDQFIDLTQPQARRMADCDARDLAAAGVGPWPGVKEQMSRFGDRIAR